MLEDVYKTFRNSAELIDWKKYNCNDLFFEYIKHEDDNLGEKFYSAIVCRYWGYSGRIYIQCNKHIPFEQCFDIVIDAINYVLRKRVWEDPNSSLYNDKLGPDKAFHIALKRQRSIVLSNLTASKRQSNFNTLSVDEIHEDYNDAAEGLFNISYDNTKEDSLKEFISGFNHKGETLNTIFLDMICYTEYTNLKNLICNIKHLSDEEFFYYKTKYDVSLESYSNVLKYIGSKSNRLLYRELKCFLYLLKKEGLFND